MTQLDDMQAAMAGALRRPMTQAIAIALLLMVGYWMLASASSLWDRDEPRFSRAGQEMVLTADHLVPRFDTDLRADKPVLIYWLMSLSLPVLGMTSELAVRMWSGLGIAGTAFCLFLAGRRLADDRTARLAMIIFGTCALPCAIATMATADGVLNLALAVCFVAFVYAATGGRVLVPGVVIAAALGVGLLVKGPVAIAVVVLSCVLAALLGGWLSNSRLPLGPRWWVAFAVACVVAIGLFLAWAIPANNATGGEFARIGLGRHVGERMLTAQEGHGASDWVGYILLLPLYLPVLLVATLPWSGLLPAAISGMIRGHVGKPGSRAILWGWSLATLGLMSLVATKLPHYILPMLPSVALILALTVRAFAHDRLDWIDQIVLKAGAWLYLVLLGGLGLALLIAPWVLGELSLAWRAMPAGMVALVAGLHLTREQVKERLSRVVRWCPGVMVLVLALVAVLVFPWLEQGLKPSPRLADAVHDHWRQSLGHPSMPKGEVQLWREMPPMVFTAGYNEPSLRFYLNLPAGERVHSLPGEKRVAAEALLKAMADHPVYVIGKVDQVLALLPDESGVIATPIIEVPTVNYSSKGQRMVVGSFAVSSVAELVSQEQGPAPDIRP